MIGDTGFSPANGGFPPINSGDFGKAPIERLNRYMKAVVCKDLSLEDYATILHLSKTMKKNYEYLAVAKKRAQITFKPEQWRELGQEIGELPRLPPDTDLILMSDCPYSKGKRVIQTHKLLPIPIGKSVNELVFLIHRLNGTPINDLSMTMEEYLTFKEIGERKASKSYWALVTTDPIPGSKGATFTDQKKLIEKCKEYELAPALEAMSLFMKVMHEQYVREGKVKFPIIEPKICCGDVVTYGDSMNAGFNNGLILSLISKVSRFRPGVLALRKLSTTPAPSSAIEPCKSSNNPWKIGALVVGVVALGVLVKRFFKSSDPS